MSGVPGRPHPMRTVYRELTEAEKETLYVFKTNAGDLYTMLESFGNSRELSTAKTKLEECVMWAVKHLTT